MKRSPMPTRKVPLRSFARLRPMSKRRRRELRQRAQVRVEVLERDGGCVARDRLPQVSCSGGDLDVHELVRRSQWRAGWLYASNAVAICRNHHRLVTERPELGHSVGLVVWSWERYE
jgi:5-methylcytosine-specific restriction endonuclease McrA